jgi:autophagy-related protein 2
MASFFQSFRASSMPKRLLRYALSRLDMLEEKTLDLDNLDLAFGRNNTFEFRDVGIIVKVRFLSFFEARPVWMGRWRLT